MFRVLPHDAFEQRLGLGGAFLAQQALAEMRPCINVLRLAFERGAVTRLRLGQLAALKIHVAELRMMMRLVEMMDCASSSLMRLRLCVPGNSKPRVADGAARYTAK